MYIQGVFLLLDRLLDRLLNSVTRYAARQGGLTVDDGSWTNDHVDDNF